MKETIKRLSYELKISPKAVTELYKSYWKFIKSTIEKLSLNEDYKEEEFNKIKRNFNIPHLGKLGVTYTKWSNLKQRYKDNLKGKYYNLEDYVKYKKDKAT